MAEASIGDGVITGEVLLTLLGNTLRVLRDRADLTQDMLAERAGTTQNQISGWENGKSWIKLKSLTAVLVGLDVSLAGFAAAMAEQAHKLDPAADWERWLKGADPGEQENEIAETPDQDSHVYIVIAAPADRVKAFTGGVPARILGSALTGDGRSKRPT